jgi:hypothetical protein
MSNPTITCPTGCLNDVPAISMDECNPAVDFSEIDKLYVTANVQPGCSLSDWTDASEWATRIDNSGTATCDIREWWVSGELPDPERNITEIDNDREVASRMKFQATLQVYETNTTNYDAVRYIQCGTQFLIWYSAGGYLYGGTDGIEASIIASHQITKGSREANMIQLLVSWEADHNPERIDNPLS